ncbi:MAG TPA: small ribosomal subunit Rsm22 family protein [Micromonosporaceae bacterium]
MADLPNDLRRALEDRLAAESTDAVRAAVGRLMDAYRSPSGAAGGPASRPSGPILSRPADVAAYAAYRMPATYAATRAVFAALPGLRPTSMVDVGGGTGAAAWAATTAYESLANVTVLDSVDGALRLGAELARSAKSDALRGATWQRVLLPAEITAADLVTVSYVIGELDDADRTNVVERAAAAGGVVVVVEPGTPAGYARIIAARDRLLALGHTVLAPCPHDDACPLAAGDWCHFGARVNRTALHRRIKGADLPYEDEKYAYVATTPSTRAAADVGVGADCDGQSRHARVIRRPSTRKGLVTLRLCRPDGTASDRNVTKREPALYRRARDTSWGDAFPP